jgi:cytoskeletal protein CcmA (bactofilin family)
MEVEKLTLIDAQTEIEGKLKGKDARILGRFRGEIDVSGRLFLGEGARVEAKVTADVAEIAGELIGDVTVRSLTLLDKARMQGGISAQALAVREGAQINGTVNAGSSDPSRSSPEQ